MNFLSRALRSRPRIDPSVRCPGLAPVAALAAALCGLAAVTPAVAAAAHRHDAHHEAHAKGHDQGPGQGHDKAHGHAPAAGGSGVAHRHGVGQLDIGLDGPRLQVSLSLPLDSLLGHERAPRSAAEREAARRAVQRLRAAGDWLRPAAAAGCRLVELTIEAPVLQAVLDETAAGASGRPALATAPAAGGKGAGGPGAATATAAPAAPDEGHADLDLDAAWQCATPQQLRGLEQRLFADHPRLQRLEVRVAGPRGQRQRVLDRPQIRIDGF